MDQSDRKRTQPDNFDSAATPPSKRHQPMMSSGESAEGQQSAAAPGQSTPMATAAAAPFPLAMPAVAAVAASSMAASSSSRISPGQRCAADPLSVAFSFLGVRSFAAVSHVSRHWRHAAELQSAWPQFSVERLIRCLIQDSSYWSQSRQVWMNAELLAEGALEQLAQSPKWLRLVELQLSGYGGDDDDDDPAWLGQVAQLPQLQSLRLDSIRLDDVAAVFSSMAPRLLALKCGLPNVNATIRPHLHLLANLRVLVLEGTVGGRALLPLHQLEYLQLRCQSDRDLLLVIRRLSVQHQLRHLSLTPDTSLKLDLTPLVAELSGADSGLAPAALVSIRLRCNLSDESPSALLSLPSLTRLDWSGDAAAAEAPPAHPQSSPPSPLQQLCLDFEDDDDLTGTASRMLQLAAARAPQLRELHIFCRPPTLGRLVRPLRCLRLLSIAGSRSSLLSQELLHALAALPLFAELVLRSDEWQRARTFQLTVDALHCMAESSSWRLIRLISSNRRQVTSPNVVDAHLVERLADFRVQSRWESGTVAYRPVASADGATTWQETVI